MELYLSLKFFWVPPDSSVWARIIVVIIAIIFTHGIKSKTLVYPISTSYVSKLGFCTVIQIHGKS